MNIHREYADACENPIVLLSQINSLSRVIYCCASCYGHAHTSLFCTFPNLVDLGVRVFVKMCVAVYEHGIGLLVCSRLKYQSNRLFNA